MRRISGSTVGFDVASLILSAKLRDSGYDVEIELQVKFRAEQPEVGEWVLSAVALDVVLICICWLFLF